ncbi:FHA domain-containing protein [Rhodoferax sp.]|uniref:FHA domain-containing protein n=1 Tax=Rhodoferax sp. TaxID=50421 RepID=UPI0025FC2B3B|nr:FHA domain-containing protein [Rhodoferax sp.]
MPHITIYLDNDFTQEVKLNKERTILGRRPDSDVIIANMAVSGRHACLIQQDEQVTIEDLDSTNGTFVNGRAVKNAVLQDGDLIEIGNFKIKFATGPSDADAQEEGLTVQASLMPMTNQDQPATLLVGRIKVVAGPSLGRELPLVKMVTTFGKPGVAVAAITRDEQNYFVHLVAGVDAPLLNGSPVGQQPVILSEGDQITLDGNVLQFSQC